MRPFGVMAIASVSHRLQRSIASFDIFPLFARRASTIGPEEPMWRMVGSPRAMTSALMGKGSWTSRSALFGKKARQTADEVVGDGLIELELHGSLSASIRLEASREGVIEVRDRIDADVLLPT